MTEKTATAGQATKGNAAILVGVLAVFALVLGGFGIAKYRVGAASTSWPTVEGQVTASGLYSHRSDDKTVYRPSIVYTYTVDGRQYSGQRISAVAAYTSRGRAEASRARYEAGTAVLVYYDPESPGSSVLEPGAGSGVILILAAAAACMVLALLILVSALRRRASVSVT